MTKSIGYCCLLSTPGMQLTGENRTLADPGDISISDDRHKSKDDYQSGVSPYSVELPGSNAFSIDRISLGTPFATLRSLGALARDESDSKPQTKRTSRSSYHSFYDPVSRGILSLNDAAKTVKMWAISIVQSIILFIQKYRWLTFAYRYFTHCHPMAPVLNESIRDTWSKLRNSNPILFLAICSVGLRFWETDPSQWVPHHEDRSLI